MQLLIIKSWQSAQSWTMSPWNEFLGRVWRPKSLMVWQTRTGSIFHAVGSALGQDWRQETKKLPTQAILHGIESLGWDELEHAQGLQGGLLSAHALLSFMPARLTRDGLAFLFLSTPPSFGSTEGKTRCTETGRQLMNNFICSRLGGGGCAR